MKIRDKLALTVVILTTLPLDFAFLVAIPATQTAQTQEILSHLSSVASIHESRIMSTHAQEHCSI